MKLIWEGFRDRALEWNVWAHFSGIATLTLLLTGILLVCQVRRDLAVLFGAIAILIGSLVYEVNEGIGEVGYSPKDMLVNVASSFFTLHVLSFFIGGVHGRIAIFYIILVGWLAILNVLLLAVGWKERM